MQVACVACVHIRLLVYMMMFESVTLVVALTDNTI